MEGAGASRRAELGRGAVASDSPSRLSGLWPGGLSRAVWGAALLLLERRNCERRVVWYTLDTRVCVHPREGVCRVLARL
jgi:hypothetical protein